MMQMSGLIPTESKEGNMAELTGQAWRAAKAEQLRQGLIQGFILLGQVDEMTPELGAEYADLAERILEIADSNDGTFRDVMYATTLRAVESEDAYLVAQRQEREAELAAAHDL
jgi:hypothetical protein